MPADSGGVGGGARVGAEACVNHEPHPRPGPHDHQRNPLNREEDHEDRRQPQLHQEEDDIESFYQSSDPIGVEMVAQEMAQSYTRLLHGSQEPQEFISLEELKPILHQDQQHTQNHNQTVSTTNNQLYHHSAQQQQSYYDLNSVPE